MGECAFYQKSYLAEWLLLSAFWFCCSHHMLLFLAFWQPPNPVWTSLSPAHQGSSRCTNYRVEQSLYASSTAKQFLVQLRRACTPALLQKKQGALLETPSFWLKCHLHLQEWSWTRKTNLARGQNRNCILFLTEAGEFPSFLFPFPLWHLFK